MTGFLVLLLTWAQFSQRVIPSFIHWQFSNIKVEKFAIGRQSFIFPDWLTLEDVRGAFLTSNVRYEAQLKSIVLAGKKIFSSAGRRISLKIRDARLSSEMMDVAGLDVEGELTNQPLARGIFSIKAVHWLGYAASDINGEFITDQQKIVIQPLKAGIYGGDVDAEIVLEYPKNVAYSIKAKFAQVDTKQLEMINASFFSNMKGKIDGDLEFRGDSSGINNIQGSLWSSQGGEIKAVLLKPLLDYLPQSTQKKDLDLLIKEQKNIPLDTAVFKIISWEDEKIKTRIDLESKKFNLDIGVPLDVNIEGGVKNLLKFQEQLFIQGR